MRGQASYKRFTPEYFPNQSLNAAHLWMWIKRILYSPVLLFSFYIQQRHIYFNNIDRFTLQQLKKLNTMNCTVSSFKVVVFAINVLAAMFGIAFIAICSLAMGAMHEEHLSFCVFGIVVGLIVCIVAFFGGYGVYRESPSYMRTYAVLLSILLVIQLTLILIFHSKDFVHMAIAELERLWTRELKNPGPMTEMQSHFQCCGLISYKDYAAANRTIPLSCYDEDKPEGSNLFLQGCREVVAHVYMYVGKVIRAIDWILCGIESTCAILACILARSFRSPSHMRYITSENVNIFT